MGYTFALTHKPKQPRPIYDIETFCNRQINKTGNHARAVVTGDPPHRTGIV